MPSEKSRFIQRCVADVTAQGKELGAAFAICTAQSQKSGYSKPGSAKMTGKGAAREKAFKNADDMQAKSAEYERAVQAGRQEEIGMRELIRNLEEAAVWKKDSAGKYERLPSGEERAGDIRSRLRVMSDKAAAQKARDQFDRLMRGMEKKPAARKHAFIDNIERVFDSFLGDKGFRADKDAVARSKAADNGSDAILDMQTGEHMSQKQIDQREARSKQAAKEREAEAANREETERKKEALKGGGHVGGNKIFTGKGSGLDKLKAGGPKRKSIDVGGEDTMPGPDGEVEGKWVTLRGKRLFFPDNPGDGVPEGPWGGAPWRPGWKSKDGDWRPGRGVPKQKGQLSLFGKHEDMESLFQKLEEASGNMWGGRMGPADKAWTLTSDDAKAINAIKAFHGHVSAGDNWLAGWSPKAQGAAMAALKAVRAGDMETAKEQVIAAQRIEMNEEAGASKAIADEILRQLGGRRFLVMTGARNLMSFDKLDDERKWPGLQVQFPQGKAKYMRIALAPSDTYTIQFMTRTGKVAKEMDDIYVDVLQRVVSDYTGLALSL